MTYIDEVGTALRPRRGAKMGVSNTCRNNPLAAQLSRTIASKTRDVPVVRGFTPIAPDDGMLAEYSTQSNHVAEDGAGRNSPFTAALLAHLTEPGIDVGTMFRRAANAVSNTTHAPTTPPNHV